MSAAMIFEDFSIGPSAIPALGPSTSDALEGYETGYKAGWDDALQAHKDSKTHLSTSLAHNLEQIEFTLIEAQSAVLASLRPVLNEVAATLLPGLSNTALQTLISSEIETLLKYHLPNEISLVVSEQDEATVATLLNATRALSEISLIAKDTLSDGQAFISCADAQRKVDVSQAILEIQASIQAFLQQPELEHANVI